MQLFVISAPWPDADQVEEHLRKMGIIGLMPKEALLPYYSVDYEVRTKKGKSKEGRTAVNASFLDLPSGLSQAIPLFRPRLLDQGMEKSHEGVPTFPKSKIGLDTFFNRVIGWIKELDGKLIDLKGTMKEIYSAYRFTLLLPVPPWVRRKEKKYSPVLSKLLGQKYAINLLFGIDPNDSIEKIEIREAELFYSKVIVVFHEGKPLFYEISEKGLEFLSGLKRLIDEIPEASNRIQLTF